MSKKYPTLDADALWALQIIRREMGKDPEYFSSPDCPYSEEVKKMFGGGLMADQSKVDVEVDLDSLDIEQEVLELYRKIKVWGASIDTADKSDQSTFFRVSTQLQEKLVTMIERTKRVSEVEAFKSAILAFADDHLSPADRTTFMDYVGSKISND